MSDGLRHLGANIRAARKRLGLTIDAVSEAAGISESFLGTVERSEASVSLETLLALADVLGVGCDALLSEGRESDDIRPSNRRGELFHLLKKSDDTEINFIIDYIKFYRGRVKF